MRDIKVSLMKRNKERKKNKKKRIKLIKMKKKSWIKLEMSKKN